MDRWDLADKEETTTKESRQEIVDAELNKIEKYLNEKFEDSALQEKAITYINLLKKQKEATNYFDADFDKYSVMWDEAYKERSTSITDIITTYNLEFPEKYQSNVSDFTINAKKVEEQQLLDSKIEEMKNSINFKPIEHSGSYTHYEAIIENITDKTFDSFSVDINLIDADGIIVESNYASVNNFASSQKAKLEFSTNKKFSSYELKIDYYIN